MTASNVPCRREGADVQLVEHEIGKRVTAETPVGPLSAGAVDHHRGPVDALGLVTGGRVGPVTLAIEAVLVAGAGADTRQRQLEHAVGAAIEGCRPAALDDHLDALQRGAHTRKVVPVS